jgi:hypothetical protein
MEFCQCLDFVYTAQQNASLRFEQEPALAKENDAREKVAVVTGRASGIRNAIAKAEWNAGVFACDAREGLNTIADEFLRVSARGVRCSGRLYMET